jgi:hypothetical protein
MQNDEFLMGVLSASLSLCPALSNSLHPSISFIIFSPSSLLHATTHTHTLLRLESPEIGELDRLLRDTHGALPA